MEKPKPLIVTCANGSYRELVNSNIVKNKSLGYEVALYDINGDLGFGTRYEAELLPLPTHERKRGKIPFKPDVISQALEDSNRFIAFMDADAFVIRPFDEVDTGDYDIGVTMIRQADRGRTQWPIVYGFLNSGVIFAYPTEGTKLFLKWWWKRVQTSESLSDQQALNELVLQACDLTEYNNIYEWRDIKIKVFSCDDYNFIYWPEEPRPTTKIVHYKTDIRQKMKAL